MREKLGMNENEMDNLSPRRIESKHVAMNGVFLFCGGNRVIFGE